MKYSYLLFVLFVSLAACQSSNSSVEAATEVPTDPKAEKSIKRAKVLPPKLYAAKLAATNSAQLIDVRTLEEYRAGFIDGASNIDFYDKKFADNLKAQLNVKFPTFVYCKSGGRSGKTAQQLIQMGFKEVYDLQGGYTAWIKAQQNELPTNPKVENQ